jgi:hypothetical protein
MLPAVELAAAGSAKDPALEVAESSIVGNNPVALTMSSEVLEKIEARVGREFDYL